MGGAVARPALERAGWLALLWLLLLGWSGTGGALAHADPAETLPPEVSYLAELVVEDPGSGPSGEPFSLLPELSGLLTPELHARLGASDDEVAQASEALEGVARGYVRTWLDPVAGVALEVRLLDLPSERQAAAGLQSVGSEAPAGVVFDRVTEDRGLVTFNGSADGAVLAGVAGHGGNYLYVVTAATAGDGAGLAGLARRTAELQQARLPAGGDVTDVAVPNAERLGEVVGTLVFTLGLVTLVRGLVVRRRRAAVRVAQPTLLPAGAVTAGREAQQLRSAGTSAGAGLLCCFGLVAAGLVPLGWPAGLAYLATGVAGIVVLAASLRRQARRGRPRRPGLPPRLLRSAVPAALSVALFAAALLLLALGVLDQLLEPSLAERDREREYGEGVSALMVWTVWLLAGGCVLLSAVAFRVARRQVRLRGAELRRCDDRCPVLYLRGFADDGLTVPAVVSGRRPLAEQWSTKDRFEAVVTWELDAAGPPVSIAPPGARLASLGAAREYAPTAEHWLEYVQREADRARVVVVSLGRSRGLLAELAAVRSRGALGRMLLLFPPVGDDELRTRWQVAREHLGAPDLDADLPLDPAQVLVALVEGQRLVAVTADLRDEAGYRAAVAAGLARLGAVAGSSGGRSSLDSGTPQLQPRPHRPCRPTNSSRPA